MTQFSSSAFAFNLLVAVASSSPTAKGFIPPNQFAPEEQQTLACMRSAVTAVPGAHIKQLGLLDGSALATTIGPFAHYNRRSAYVSFAAGELVGEGLLSNRATETAIAQQWNSTGNIDGPFYYFEKFTDDLLNGGPLHVNGQSSTSLFYRPLAERLNAELENCRPGKEKPLAYNF